MVPKSIRSDQRVQTHYGHIWNSISTILCNTCIKAVSRRWKGEFSSCFNHYSTWLLRRRSFDWGQQSPGSSLHTARNRRTTQLCRYEIKQVEFKQQEVSVINKFRRPWIRQRIWNQFKWNSQNTRIDLESSHRSVLFLSSTTARLITYHQTKRFVRYIKNLRSVRTMLGLR